MKRGLRKAGGHPSVYMTSDAADLVHLTLGRGNFQSFILASNIYWPFPRSLPGCVPDSENMFQFHWSCLS